MKTSCSMLGLGLLVMGCSAAAPPEVDRPTANPPAASPAAVAATEALAPPQGPASCPPPPPGPTGLPCLAGPSPTSWWPADLDANDVVGGHHGQLRNGAKILTPAVRGKAFRLNSTASGKRFVEVPHDPALNLGTGDFTLSLWVRFTNLANEMVLAEKWSWSGSPPQGWTLTRLASGMLRFAAGGEGETEFDTAPIGFTNKQWYQVAVTRAAGVLTIYVNGVPRACGLAPQNLDSTVPLTFGHRGPGDPGAFRLRGSIDEVQLWVGSALDEASIANLWAFTLAGASFCP